MEVIKKGLGDENNQKKLAEALNNLPDTLKKMNSTFARTDEALKTFTERTGEGDNRKSPVERLVHTIEIVEQRLHEFGESSDPDHPAPAEQIKHVVDNINEITRIMAEVMKHVEDKNGSVNKFLNDTELYDRLSKAARNVEQLTRDLRPIVRDAGVLMDKEARHPGAFLRDAVKPGVGIK